MKTNTTKIHSKNHYIRTVCRWHWSNVPFGDVYRPWLAKQHSPKRQIEHVTNSKKYWTFNRNKLLKKWHEKSKEWKAMQKYTENTVNSGKIQENIALYTYLPV